MKGGGYYAFSSSSSSFWSAWSASSAPSEIWTSLKDRISDVRCLDPYVAPGRIAWPCGRCPSCRINCRRIWTHRIMLEAMQHAENCFVTLTYRDVPPGGGLEPSHLQGWLKRLRSRTSPSRLRHYCVGEYGDRTFRPHYHGAIFGLGCRLGPYRTVVGGGVECQCPTCAAVRGSWNYGFTTVGTLEEKSAAYIAGYVLKKMNTTWDTTSPLLPPFARMSLNPGIGAGAIPDVASVVMRYKLEERSDVPLGLRHGSAVYPFGRYLRRKLRAHVGLDEGCPDHVIEALRQGLLPVFDYADVVLAHPTVARYKRDLVRSAFKELNTQVNANISARSKVYRGSL